MTGRRYTLAALTVPGLLLVSVAGLSSQPVKPTFKTTPNYDFDYQHALDGVLHDASAEAHSADTHSQQLDRLTMVDSISLAISSNLGVKSAYQGRVSERLALETAESKFNPYVALDGKVSVEGGDTATTTFRSPISGDSVTLFDDTRERRKDSTWNTSIGPKLVWDLPTGANLVLNLQLEADSKTLRDSSSSLENSDENAYGANMNLAISQPLMKGAGTDINSASIEIARIQEKANVMRLRDTVENTVTETVLAYRALIQAEKAIQINQNALEKSMQNLENKRLQVSAGSLPREELVQYQTQIRQQQISLKQSEISHENAMRTLARVLGQPLSSQIETSSMIEKNRDMSVGFDQALAVALSNRSDYQNALLTVENARIAVELAENNLLWDLNLVGGVHASVDDTRNNAFYVGSDVVRSTTRDDNLSWNIGLNIVIPLYDSDQDQRAAAIAQNALLEAELAVENIRQSVALDVRNAITALDGAWDQLELSKELLELSQHQFEVEQEKLKYGRSSSFNVISMQNDYESSKLRHLDTQIAHLNALTQLDKTLGTTLVTWNIDIGE
ncbi:MAG: TolC family protein [bacterium]